MRQVSQLDSGVVSLQEESEMHQIAPADPLDLVMSQQAEYLTVEQAVLIVENAVTLLAGYLESKNKTKFSKNIKAGDTTYRIKAS